MLQRIRELLVLVLIVLLPFHALLVTVGTRLLVGAGQAPLPALAFWKECILGLILTLSFIEIAGRNPKFQIPNSKKIPTLKFQMDILDWLIVGLIILGFLIPSSNFIYGFKYTLFPLCLFLILRRVAWSEMFKQRVLNMILVVGGVVAGYGILTFFLPMGFFTWLGYSDLHSLYLPDGPLAAFQQIGGTGIRRIQSTFSGPNQLGVWLLIPLSIVIQRVILRRPARCVMVRSPEGASRTMAQQKTCRPSRRQLLRSFLLRMTRCTMTRRVVSKDAARDTLNYSLVLLISIALFLTFSRAAWIAAATIVIVSFYCNSKYRPSTEPVLSKVEGLRVTLAVATCVFIAFFIFPDILLRTTSTRGHLQKPLAAIQTIIAHPFGLGLGSAGPASNRVSDPCVFLEESSDASWAKDRPNLCVFVGDNQVQPVGETCQCPFLPENWYLQVGVELGILGFVLFVILTVLTLFRTRPSTLLRINSGVRLVFLGVSMAGLFLHVFEDSAVAYTLWILVAMMLPCTKGVLLSSTLGANTRT